MAIITMLKNSEFLAALLSGSTGYGWVCAFPGDPGNKKDAQWWGRPYLPSPQSDAEVDGYADRNSYFSVAELKYDEKGRAQRIKANFLRLRALVSDDTMDGAMQGHPTWTIETSPGKVQNGILIDPEDPDAADVALVDEVMSELYRMKLLGDSSGNSVVRYVRLPQGTNQKPRETGDWQHNIIHWNPSHVLSLADACGVFGIDLDSLRSKAALFSSGADGGAQLFGDKRQSEVMLEAITQIVTNDTYHDPINRLASSLANSGMHPGASVNLLRALMMSVQGPRKPTWQERYDDIPRSVQTAVDKGFQAEPWAPPAERDSKPLLVGVDELLEQLEPVDWLIEGWVEANALSMLYGPSNVGKSFLMIEWACCVATGTPFFGQKVKQGPVVIVVGEGKRGIAKRLAAWQKHHGVSLKGAPLRITRKAVPLLDQASAMELVSAIDDMLVDLKGVPPAFVGIDTLARNFGPGDENSAKDASQFVDVIDEHLRQRYSAHVQIVHHSGHEAGRARGSSAFRAAMDQEFSFSSALGGTVARLEARKMKDAEKPKPFDMQLKVIDLGEDKEGGSIESLVLDRVTSEWDDVLLKGKKKTATVGAVLEMVVDGEIPSKAAIMEEFGVSSNGAVSLFAKIKERGYIEDGQHAKARKMITLRGAKLLSQAGRLLGAGKLPESVQKALEAEGEAAHGGARGEAGEVAHDD